MRAWCIPAFQWVFEEDKAEEEECKIGESEKGDGFSSHSGSLFASKMYFQVFLPTLRCMTCTKMTGVE